MAGFSDAVETALLALIFNATAWANYADNAASTPQTNVAVGLHTADPTDSGSMTSSETSYTSYARASVARTSGGWTVTGNSVSPAANIDFATGTGGSGTVTHFSTGKTGGGAAAIIMAGTVTPNISVGNGIIPRLTTSTSMTLD
jgi:hypothetical protein